MAREHRTTIKLSEELHRRVKAKAALQGCTLSDVFRLLLEKWERGEIELSELEDRSQQENEP